MDSVLERLFRPLARLCVAKGVRFADAVERLRVAFYSAGVEAGGETDSRLAVLTGLQRRDVARLRGGAVVAVRETVHPCARIVSLWMAEGHPRVLPLRGVGPSFESLAKAVRKDVHARTLLEALAEAGTVAVEGSAVRLLREAYQPLPGSDDQLATLAANVSDHLAAAVGNVTGGPEQFERAVHYQGLSAEAVAELQALWAQRMAEALAEVNAKAQAMPEAANGTRRFRAGAYFHEEEAR